MTSTLRDVRILGITIVVLVTGCVGVGTAPIPSPPPSGLLPYVTSAETGPTAGHDSDVLPLQHYMIRGRDYQTVQRAWNILRERCMHDLGFELEFPEPPEPDLFTRDLSYRRYGLASLEEAQQYGYGLPPEASSDPEARQRSRAFDESLTPEMRVALSGERKIDREGSNVRRGCNGEADRALMGSATLIRLAGLPPAEIVREVNLDPRGSDSPASREAIEKFVACMADAGYPELAGPVDVPKQFLATDGKADAAQIEAAVTHFRCQESSGTSQAMREADTAFQLAAIEANPEAFAQIKAENDEVIRRATTILENS